MRRILVVGVLGMLACGDPIAERDALPACDGVGLTATQRRRAEQLTSLFENGTIELQYGYAEALDDGRGITAGRAGFTTATGDAVLVVQAYVDAVPSAPIGQYLPRLRAIPADPSRAPGTDHIAPVSRHHDLPRRADAVPPRRRRSG